MIWKRICKLVSDTHHLIKFLPLFFSRQFIFCTFVPESIEDFTPTKYLKSIIIAINFSTIQCTQFGLNTQRTWIDHWRKFYGSQRFSYIFMIFLNAFMHRSQVPQVMSSEDQTKPVWQLLCSFYYMHRYITHWSQASKISLLFNTSCKYKNIISSISFLNYKDGAVRVMIVIWLPGVLIHRPIFLTNVENNSGKLLHQQLALLFVYSNSGKEIFK